MKFMDSYDLCFVIYIDISLIFFSHISFLTTYLQYSVYLKIEIWDRMTSLIFKMS